MFDCEIANLREFELCCRDVKIAMGIGCVRGVERGIREAVDDARAHHTFKNQSGELEKSIGGSVEVQQAAGAIGEIHADSDHASYVENPTRAHVIRPKADAGGTGPLDEGQSRMSRKEVKAFKDRNRERRFARVGYTTGARMLSWVSGGVRHFARVVHHPGTRGQPFMGPAYFKAERVAMREIEAAIPIAQAEIDK